ncbi:MAG: HPP family protein [Pseudomonadota bacterium]|nr:HPP family protein [Pseudomonadota bacterium]
MPRLYAFINQMIGRQSLSHREIPLVAASALVALTLVAVISNRTLLAVDWPFIVASMGASAVLLFAVPSSPMNRPWALVMGHLSSAVVGVTCAQHIDSLVLAAPIAGATAILVMLYLRCLHPPGGATAMLIVLGDDHVHAAGYQFILTPIALNVLILLSAALVIRAITGALRQGETGEVTIARINKLEQRRTLAPRLTEADIVAARAQLDTYIDVQDEQLLQLLRLATHNTHQRRLGDLRCQALMLPVPLCAEFGTPLAEVWGWFQKHHLTAVPVIDRARHVIGIITLHDFIHHAAGFPHATLEERIAALIKTTPELTSDKPEVAGQIMTTPVVTAQQDACVAELLPLLDNRHIHHIPIVDANDKLSGLLSRNEIVVLLERDEAPV